MITTATYSFRVRYVECDPMGVMHHSAYLPYLELGRTELLRACGIAYRDLEARNVLFVVTKIAISYKRPARYDDELELTTRITRQTTVRIDHAYELRNAAREIICTAESTIACVNRQGEVIQIPDDLRPPESTESR
jgi:acyl-CoA thioester hydrolase